MAISITGIEKKGPVVICSTNDTKNRAYKVDFKEGKIYGISGKPLKSSETILHRIPYSMYHLPLCRILTAFTSDANRSAGYYSAAESLLSYPDLLLGEIRNDMINFLVTDCDSKLPKGYVTWCRENNRGFSYESLNAFFLYKKFLTWPESLVENIKRFSEGVCWDMAKATDYDKELCASLLRIANNSLKRYEISDLRSTLKDIVNIVQRHTDLRPYLDETKSAKVAYQILDNVLYKERNKKILANESKIAALDGIVIGDCMIVVPSTMDDFTNEGNQQHNCVGYFYHDRIAKGEQLIYFLRKTGNPTKSYVTCRFDMREKETVEHRLQHNCWFEDEGKMLSRIDTMIKNLLKAQ